MAFSYQLTDKIGTKATLGLIVLQPDETIEHDMRRMLPMEDVTLYVSRIPSEVEVSNDSLAAMRADLPTAARLMPRGLRLDAVGYGCTSASSVIGPAAIADLIHDGCDTGAVTEPLSALIAACRHLGITRIGFLSPYIEDVSATLRAALAKAGVESPVFGSFDEAVEANVARIDGPSIIAAAKTLADQGGIEALFLSCTNLRTLDVIDRIEAETGLTVLASNQVLAWHMGQITGFEPAPFGRLMRKT